MTLPNFLFIGPDKSGSTWIYNLLDWHPQIFVPAAKELFFFDSYYDLGIEWYARYFREAESHHKIVGEVSHDYLFSSDACRRISRDLDSVRLMVCLREPVDRAFSSYLYMIRQGRLSGSFEEALEQTPELVEHGQYARHLAPYLETFGVERIHIAVFDDLVADPERFAGDLFDFLGVESPVFPDSLRGRALGASRPRSPALAKAAKRTAVALRDFGLPEVVTAVKSSAVVQKMLYSPYREGGRPEPDEATTETLRGDFAATVAELDGLIEGGLASRWGYERA